MSVGLLLKYHAALSTFLHRYVLFTCSFYRDYNVVYKIEKKNVHVWYMQLK